MEHDKLKNNLTVFVSMSALVLACLAAEPANALTLSCAQPLVFGTLTVTCGTASTVTIKPDGSRSITGCMTGTGPFSNGSCNVSQTFPFQSIKVSVPAGAKITRTGGAQTMPINTFNLMTNAHGAAYTTSGPFANIPVGAKLNAGASPTSGYYTGSFTVTAVFQ